MLDALLITRGEHGMTLLSGDGKELHLDRRATVTGEVLTFGIHQYRDIAFASQLNQFLDITQGAFAIIRHNQCVSIVKTTHALNK
jgi:bifunctional ADP-heptose synthase (sugar kinase/adenylyltransferase)